jgi:peptidoglycan/xylan/chitin deacetylase (PgdA/CDA1 family)
MLKSMALQLLLVPGADSLFAPFARQCGVVFMLHRFRGPGYPPDGYDPAALRRALEYLRRRKYNLVSIDTLLRYTRDGRPVPDRSVAFTIDDGYADHAEMAAPIFADFDCPVTTFVTTGFLDEELWFWWDQIEFVFANSVLPTVLTQLGDSSLQYSVRSAAERAAATIDFVGRCKVIPNSLKLEAIERLAIAAEVRLPVKAPARYAPMTWNQLRACEARGMTFGPHTVTHPILSRVSDQQSHWELTESWRRLGEEARHPVPVFCYPNGGAADYSDREIATLTQMNFLGAVVGSAGFVSSGTTTARQPSLFETRRFPFPDRISYLVQSVSGLERMKFMLRSEPV